MNSNSLHPSTLLKFTDPGYEEPTFEDVRALKEACGLTGKEMSALAGIDQRAFRRWTSPADRPGARTIPYSAWRLMLVELGVV